MCNQFIQKIFPEYLVCAELWDTYSRRDQDYILRAVRGPLGTWGQLMVYQKSPKRWWIRERGAMHRSKGAEQQRKEAWQHRHEWKVFTSLQKETYKHTELWPQHRSSCNFTRNLQLPLWKAQLLFISISQSATFLSLLSPRLFLHCRTSHRHEFRYRRAATTSQRWGRTGKGISGNEENHWTHCCGSWKHGIVFLLFNTFGPRWKVKIREGPQKTMALSTLPCTCQGH